MKKSFEISLKLFVSIIFLFILFLFTNFVQAKGIDGTTIVLNAGHGGGDSGCINRSKGLTEKEINLKITKYLEAELNKYYNVKVILTHDGVNFPNDDYGDLAARAMVARNNNAELYVSLHINDASNNTSRNGSAVYITSRTELPKYNAGMTILGNKILKNLEKLGIRIDEGVKTRLCSNTKEEKYKYYDGSYADYYGDIRYSMRGDSLAGLGQDFRDGSGIPTVLVEHCFMNNSHDVQFLDSDSDLQKLAKADADAIVDYLELKLPNEIITKINVSDENVNLLNGETKKVTATIEPSTAPNKEVKWKSSNENVAKVDEQGNITAVSIGKATITVTSVMSPNVSKSINVNVEEYGIKLEKDTEYILLNKTGKLNVTATPSWITNKNITWSSDNQEIVEVANDGTITAKKAGQATVTVTWQEQNLQDTIIVNVIELPEGTKAEFPNNKVEEHYISKIGEKVTVQDFLSKASISSNLEAVVQIPKEGQNYIGTGTKVIIKEKEHGLIVDEYECLIYGDIDGDGRITSMDYTLIKIHIMETQMITDNLMKITADVDGDGKITSMDYTLIKIHIMDLQKINLR